MAVSPQKQAAPRRSKPVADDNLETGQETYEISLDRLQSMLKPEPPQSRTPSHAVSARKQEKQELILVIHGVVERITLSHERAIVLGRSNVDADETHFDLTPYGALDRGVSRQHARIHMDDGRLFVTDLGSTNGTYLAGKRLEPHFPTRIGTGDPLMLARLPIQILFK